MTTVTAPDRPQIFDQRYRALSVGMVALFMLVAFEYLAVATAMPAVARELEGHHLYSLAFSGGIAAALIATVAGGRWGDVRGPDAPLWTGLLAFLAGLTLAGAAPTMEVFLLGRFLQGFGGGMFDVAIYVLVGRVYPAATHPRVFSLLAAAWVLPSVVGPAITGFVTQHFSWRWVFLAVPVLAAPAVFALWRGLAGHGRAAQHENPEEVTVRETGWESAHETGRESLHETGRKGGTEVGRRRLDGSVGQGAGQIGREGGAEVGRRRLDESVGQGARDVEREVGRRRLVESVGQGAGDVEQEGGLEVGRRRLDESVGQGVREVGQEDVGLGGPAAASTADGGFRLRLAMGVLAAIGAGLLQYGSGGGNVVLIVAGLVVLAVSLPRLLPRGTMRGARGLPAVVALRGIATGAFLAAEVLIPLVLFEERGLSPDQGGIALTGGALFWSLGSWIQGRKPYRRNRALALGCALIAVGVAVTAPIVVPEVPVWVAFVGWSVAGFGIGVVYPTLSVLVLELSEPGEQGKNSASLAVGESVLTVVAIAVTGAIFTVSAAYALCFVLLAAMAGAGVLLAGRVTMEV
ncbi:MFS transporter [Acrocarpospora sp. B8E8]|uniref:MFS transporter n=1 Tax=Acrocarpospora sp. B8E8 TaxID=3153572 RepID=UPI00325E2D64